MSHCRLLRLRKVLHSTQYETGHFGDVLASQFLGSILKKITQTHYSGLQAANTTLLTATRTHMSYEITQCYLPPGRSDSLSIND